MTTPTHLISRGQRYNLPIFCPDATRGVVRSLDSLDLHQTGTHGIIVNTWHLHSLGQRDILATLGGIKKMMNYNGLVISDSGGFQVYSLFQKTPEFGKITDEGLVTYTGPKKQHKILFTPEDSIRMQMAIGADILICLDDYTPSGAPAARVKESVRRTLDWARRCRRTFDQECQKRHYTRANRPLLFAVVQGGDDLSARQECARGLLAIGFDGYGLGGAKFTPDGHLDLAWAKASAALTPPEFPRYALGFGKPDEILALHQAGYQIFDTVLPTRDARHGRLYIHPENAYSPAKVYQFLNLTQGKYATDTRPPDPLCDCHTCRHFSRAYLHHLLRLGDATAWRLTTIHNLHFYNHLFDQVKP